MIPSPRQGSGLIEWSMCTDSLLNILIVIMIVIFAVIKEGERALICFNNCKLAFTMMWGLLMLRAITLLLEFTN